MEVHNKYNVVIVLMLNFKTPLLRLRLGLGTGVVVWLGLRVG